MKITDVKTVLLTGPSTDDPYLAASKRLRSAAFIEIETDTPHVGLGETYAGYYFPELVPPIVEFFKPILVNADTLDIHTLRRRMLDCGMFWGRVGVGPAVLSGIEAALWDLKGKLLGVPVYELLGGKCHDRLPAYATGGPSNWPLEQLLAKIDFYLGLGFRAFKVAAGYFDAASGEARLSARATRSAIAEFEGAKAAAMRRHVGPEVRILMDGHMGTSHGADTWDLPTAQAVLAAVEPHDIYFFEEPLPYTDPWGYGELARSSAVPVAGGEQLTTFEEFRQFAECGAFDIAQPDAAWVGLSEFVNVGRLFAQRNRWVASHAWGAGGAVMQNIHAAFATPNAIIVEIPPAAGALHTRVWGDSLQMVEGAILPPTAPGLGITLSDEVKAAYPFVPGQEEFVSVPGKVLKP